MIVCCGANTGKLRANEEASRRAQVDHKLRDGRRQAGREGHPATHEQGQTARARSHQTSHRPQVSAFICNYSYIYCYF